MRDGLTISAQVRIAAIVALLVILGVGATAYMRPTHVAPWLIGLAALAGALGPAVGGSLLRRSIGRAVSTLVAEVERLEQAVARGQLDLRGDPAAVSPEFRPVVEGMNKTLDAFVAPLRLAARHIEGVARGDIPESLSGDWRGEFAAIQRNLNQCAADLTSNRKRFAAAQKQLFMADRLSTIGTLAGGVAHEINNPLAAVVASLDYLSDKVPALLEAARRQPEDAALAGQAAGLTQVFADARCAAQRVASVVRDLATVAHSDPASAERVSLPQVLETALTLASSELKRRVRIVREMGPVPPVMANGGKLARAFLHLLVNAAQAVAAKPSGEGEIRLVTRTDEYGGAVVEVIDDGPGIDRAAREHLFEPFFTTKPPGTGKGLGLAVCHGIVLALGGRLEVESEPGRGSLFRVVLPAAPAEERRAAGSGGPAQALRGRLLLVEHEPLERRTIARLLGGHDVVAVASAEEALGLVDQGERFDLVLCEADLPGMDGRSLHRTLSERAPELARRFAFLAGAPPPVSAQELLAYGGRPILTKPISAAALRAEVQRWLARSRAPSSADGAD